MYCNPVLSTPFCFFTTNVRATCQVADAGPLRERTIIMPRICFGWAPAEVDDRRLRLMGNVVSGLVWEGNEIAASESKDVF